MGEGISYQSGDGENHRNRDLTEESQIQKFLYGKLDCYSPWLLKDMDKAVEEILKAVKGRAAYPGHRGIMMWGICSSYILTKGFQMLGAQVDTAIHTEFMTVMD